VSFKFLRQAVQKDPFSISELVHIRSLMHLLFSVNSYCLLITINRIIDMRCTGSCLVKATVVALTCVWVYWSLQKNLKSNWKDIR